MCSSTYLALVGHFRKLKKKKDVQDVECFHNVWEKNPNTLEISFKLKLSMFS
jgi:hypothetical protein